MTAALLLPMGMNAQSVKRVSGKAKTAKVMKCKKSTPCTADCHAKDSLQQKCHPQKVTIPFAKDSDYNSKKVIVPQ